MDVDDLRHCALLPTRCFPSEAHSRRSRPSRLRLGVSQSCLFAVRSLQKLALVVVRLELSLGAAAREGS